MRSVKSVSDLRRLAVNAGATVNLGGASINAAGAKADAQKPAPKPVDPPKAEPPKAEPAPDHRPEMYALMAEQARDQARLTESLMQALVQREPASPRVPWQFNVQYDREGRIVGVTANPVEGE